MSHACKILQATAENIDLCVDLLRDEAVVGVPTETVYGLAGNALNEIQRGAQRPQHLYRVEVACAP